MEHVIRLAENDEFDDDGAGDLAESIDEHGNVVSKLDNFRATAEFKAAQAEVRKIQPTRIGIFKRYWDKFKFNKKRREKLVAMFDETDEQIEFYLIDDFVSWKDEIEGARQFLEDIKIKKVEDDIKLSTMGNTVIRTIAGKTHKDTQEIEYSSQTFNPFDTSNIKT